MHFLLYLPGERARQTQLVDLGLADLVYGAHPLKLGEGPDGGPGLLLSWRANSGGFRLVFQPEMQTWIPSLRGVNQGPGAYWVGWWTDAPPGPEDLLRERPYRGVSIPLGDGQPWTFPRISSVPRDVLRGDDGQFYLSPQPRFAQFCLAADRWSQILRTMPEGGGVLVDELAEFCELALRLNYRLTPEIPSQLRLWSSGEAGTLAAAVLGMLLPEGET